MTDSTPGGTRSTDELFVKAKFGGVALVCGECEKRSSGPPKLKARQVRKLLRAELHNLPVRLRIVQSSCLGLCPKKAITVSAIAPGRVLTAEVHSKGEASAVAAALADAFRTKPKD